MLNRRVPSSRDSWEVPPWSGSFGPQSPSYRVIEDAIAMSKIGSGNIVFDIRNSDLKAGLTILHTADALAIGIRFPRLLASMAQGINRQLAEGQKISKATITGQNVVNASLIDQLRSFGFVSERSSNSTLMKRTRCGYPFVANAFTQFFGGFSKLVKLNGPPSGADMLLNPYKKAIKPGVGAFAAFQKLRAVRVEFPLGDTWKLELELEKTVDAVSPLSTEAP